MGLLQHLNFSRSVILVSFLGSAVLGYFVYQKYGEVELYREFIESGRAENGVFQNVAKARELEELMKTASRENFGSNASDLELYISTAAAHEQVHVGQVNIGKPDEDSVGKGLVDVKFKIEPPRSGKDSFTLGEISNFAYQLEQVSNRVKVTRMRIEPAGKNNGRKPHNVLEDRWKFELEARVRIKQDE